MIDGLTAVFLLNGESVTSTTGKDVVSFYRGQFINFEESNISLPSSVLQLVPLLQGICSFVLSAPNLNAVVEAVVGLACKERVWVFVCARRRQERRAPSQKLFETKSPRLPAVPATRSLPNQRFERFL